MSPRICSSAFSEIIAAHRRLRVGRPHLHGVLDRARHEPALTGAELKGVRVLHVVGDQGYSVGDELQIVQTLIGERPQHLLHFGHQLDLGDTGDHEQVGHRGADDEGELVLQVLEPERVVLVGQKHLAVGDGDDALAAVDPALQNLDLVLRLVGAEQLLLALVQ
jgi:hypothetical protein